MKMDVVHVCASKKLDLHIKIIATARVHNLSACVAFQIVALHSLLTALVCHTILCCALSGGTLHYTSLD